MSDKFELHVIVVKNGNLIKDLSSVDYPQDIVEAEFMFNDLQDVLEERVSVRANNERLAAMSKDNRKSLLKALLTEDVVGIPAGTQVKHAKDRETGGPVIGKSGDTT